MLLQLVLLLLLQKTPTTADTTTVTATATTTTTCNTAEAKDTTVKLLGNAEEDVTLNKYMLCQFRVLKEDNSYITGVLLLMMNTVYVFEISSKKFYICSLSIKRFHPYFELFYFRHRNSLKRQVETFSACWG